MSDGRQETIADIMAEMRTFADSMEKHLLYDLRECATDYLRVLADRIEAADHRFREITKMIPHAEAAAAEMETTTPTSEESSVVGNAVAMREALEKVRFYLPHFLQYMRLHREDEEAGGYYERILEVVNDALAAPPRNCDVGTAEEQTRRWNRFCYRHECLSCPVEPIGEVDCILAWSQMPYDEGGAK